MQQLGEGDTELMKGLDETCMNVNFLTCSLRAVPRFRQLGLGPVASSENKVDNILTCKFEILCQL